ncbi:hypothetical protein [Streptomyces sp. NPDC060194]|uniref:hypothetical protein n=1 Tax=Streptomyces sp. NPDC060194 TaxID=3347069 RepID=UPI00364D08EF
MSAQVTGAADGTGRSGSAWATGATGATESPGTTGTPAAGSAHAPHGAGPGEARAAVAEGRGWAWGAIAAGIGGVLVFAAAGPLWPYAESDLRDNALMVGKLEDSHMWWVYAVQFAFTLAAFGAVLFAAGLRRRLERQCPAGSLVPVTAYLGLLLTGVMSLVGTGMGTESFFAVQQRDKADPDTVITQLAQLGTYGWLWTGLLLTAAALVVAAFRQGAVSRWIGVVSALFAVVALIVALAPFQYMALFVGAPYLLVLGAGFAFGRREA